MPLVPGTHFKDIGVLIGVLNSLTAKKEEFKDDVVDAVEQLDADFPRVSTLPSFIANMVAAANAITSGESNVVTASSTYHTAILKAELPSTATTVSGVITDLFSEMAGFLPVQTFMQNGNFHKLYRDRYGRTDAPTAPSGSNTVNDALGD